MREINALLERLKFGETVLLEHNSLTTPARGLYYLVKWAQEKNYQIIIDDVLDTLYLYSIQIKLSGLDPSILDSVNVIKEGGRIEVGNVVKRLPIKEAGIQEKEYAKVFDPLLEQGRIINPVVGTEKLLLLSPSKREILTILNTILSYTGNEKRIAFYFINTDLLEKSNPCVIPMLEEIATTVIKVSKQGRETLFSVVKSVNNEIDGKEIKL